MIYMALEYFTEDLVIQVRNEMMTNAVICDSFDSSIDNEDLSDALPEADGGEWRWIWLKGTFGPGGPYVDPTEVSKAIPNPQVPAVDTKTGKWTVPWYGRMRGDSGRTWPEFGKDFEVEITAPFVRPDADAILLLGAFARVPDRYDLLMPFVQYDRKVQYYGDILENSEDRPTLNGEHMQPLRDISGTPTMVPGVFEVGTLCPPGICSEYYFRCEAHAQTDEGADPEFAQAAVGMIGNEGESVGSETTFFQRPTAKGHVPAQYTMQYQGPNFILVIPPGRDFVYFGGEAEDHSSVTLMFSGYTLTSAPDPIAIGDAWVTLWEVPVGWYKDPAEFGTPAQPENPWSWAQNDVAGLNGTTTRQYIPATNLKNIPLDYEQLRVWIQAGYSGGEGTSLSKAYIGNADVNNLPSFLGAPIQLTFEGDTSPLLTARQNMTSAAIELARLSDTGLIVSAHFDSAANDTAGENTQAEYSTGNITYSKAGDDAATQGVVTGYTPSADNTRLVRRIEVKIEV